MSTRSETRRLNLREEERFQAPMDADHYLGALPKMGNALWLSLPGTASGWRC
jgi:hypothetical protein